MSKFSDIKEALTNMIRRDDAMPKESKEENASMADGVDDAAYGLKRKVIYGVVGVIVVAFISFTYFSSMDNDSPTETKKAKQEEASRSPKDDNRLPNDYEQLQRMNEQKAAQPGQAGKPGQVAGQTNTARNNAAAAQPQAQANAGANQAANRPAANQPAPAMNTLPAIPSRSYNQAYMPTYMAAAPQGADTAIAAPGNTAGASAREKDKYSSAISFSVGENAKGGAGAGTPPATQANAAATEPAENGAPAATAQPLPLLNGGVSYVAAIPNSVQAGTVIPAVLLTGVNTDVGGQVIAQVSGDVYDSLTGQNLLIPAGSRLVGKVEAGVKDTQKRVNIAWDYLLLPNGGSYALGSSMIAADYGGYAGISGRVDHHTSSLLRSGFLSSAFAALGSIAAGNTRASSETYSAGQLAGQGAMANMMNAAASLFNKGVEGLQTTITVKPGAEFMVYVTQTVQFAPYPVLQNF